MIIQAVLGTTFLGIAFWEAHVADTHEPIGNNYNDITIVAYYYTVLKCVLNIFSGLTMYVDCMSKYYSALWRESSPQETMCYMVHFLCVTVSAILYLVYLNHIKYIYRMVIFWDIAILSGLVSLIILIRLVKYVSVVKNPNAALIHPVVV